MSFITPIEGDNGGGGLFLRLKDGESAEILVRSKSTYGYPQTWITDDEGKLKPEVYDEKKHGEDAKVSFRQVLDVLDVKSGKPQVFELASKFMDEFGNVVAEVSTPGTHDALNTKLFRFKRKGTGRDTSYVIVPLGDAPKEMLDKAKEKDLIDLPRALGHTPAS